MGYNVSEKKGKRWSLGKEKRSQVANLKTLGVDDDNYESTLDSIERIDGLRRSKFEVVGKVLKDVGMVALAGVAVFLAYSVDKSDDLPKNKNSMNIFTKIFRF